MRHRPWLFALLAVAVGCPLACPPRPDGMHFQRGRAELEPAPVLTCKPDRQFRWLDALDQPYGESFRQSFSYEDPQVVITFADAAPTFRGELHARGLKPNFAYQMKLVGMPAFLWPNASDDATNRRLGTLGRWWRPGETGGNVYVYESDPVADQPDKREMEGYLVFDYFVTDANGNADVTFRLDRSLHVLWKTSQWPPAQGDTEPTQHPILAEAETYGYDESFPPGEVKIYAEHERGRPPVGEVSLPPGRYRCFFLLTEESFHAWEGNDGGEWAAALAAPIEFTITEDEPTAESAKAQGGLP